MKFFKLLALLTALGTAAQAQQQSTKVGYASVDYIISKLPEFKSIQDQLKGTQAKLQKEYETRTQAFQRDYQDYIQKRPTMADTARARIEERLQRASVELQTYEGEAQRTYDNAQKLALAPLYLRVSNSIRDVARAQGYEIILNSGSDLLLFAGEKEDISDLVVAHMTTTLPVGK